MIEIVNDIYALSEQTVLLAGGLALLGLGAIFFADLIVHRRRSIELDGRIVGVVNQGDAANPMYFPIVDLLAPGVGKLRATGDAGSSHVRDDIVGRPVRVLYRSDKPETVRVVSSSRAVIGAIFSVLGLGLLTIFFYAYAASWLSGLIGLVYFCGLSVAFASARATGMARVEQALPQAVGDDNLVAIETIRAANARANRFNRVFSPILALLGALVLAGGVYSTIMRVEFVSVALSVQGRITGFEQRDFLRAGSSSWTLSVYPVFSFVTKEGRTVEVSDDIGSRHPQHRVGESVAILYDPRDPNLARIDRGPGLWILPGALVSFGLLALLSGAVVWRRLRRQLSTGSSRGEIYTKGH